MAEEAFETAEMKERLEEAAERGAEAVERGLGWIKLLSLTTAVIAVLAALASLESGSFSNEALIQKNESLLAQQKASDQWAFYQAKGVKAVVYAAQGDTAHAQKETTDQQEISTKAKEFEAEVESKSHESDRSLEHHHRFAYSVTMFQVSIALAAIAALSRQKAVWMVGLLIGALGLAYFFDGFLVWF